MKISSQLLCGLILLLHATVYPGSLTAKFIPTGDVTKPYLTAAEENNAKLEELKKQLEETIQKRQEFSTTRLSRLSGIKQELDKINASAKFEPDNHYLNKKSALSNERYSTIKAIQQLFDKEIEFLEQHIKTLEEYLQDPLLEKFKRERGLDKAQYQFEDLQHVDQMIIDYDKTLAQLATQQENADDEFRNWQRAALATREAYKEKQQALTKPELYEPQLPMSSSERAELVRLEEQLYADKQQNDDFRLREVELKKDAIKSKIFVTKLKRDSLKKAMRAIKPAIRISEADIAHARDELSKARKRSFETKDTFRQQTEMVMSESKLHEDALRELSKRYNIALGTDLDDWSRDPKETALGYRTFIEVAYAEERLQLLQRQKDLIEVRMVAEDEMLRYDAVRADVMESFYKIAARKFHSEDEANQELKKYDTPKAEAEANLSLFKERKNKAEEHLALQNRALKNIRELRKEVQGRKSTIFRGDSEDYLRCNEFLNAAEKLVVLQIDVINKIIATYTDAITTASKTVKQVDFIRSEIGLASFWYRPEHAISWEGVKGSLAEIKSFFFDLYAVLKSYEIRSLFTKFYNIVREPLDLILFILGCVVIWVLLLVFRNLLPTLANKALAIGQTRHVTNTLLLLCAALCGFFIRYYWYLVSWFLLLLALELFDVMDPYPYVVFYLLSIPYLLYFAYKLIHYLQMFNERNGYVFVNKDFQPRCIQVFSGLLYATIAIFFFRNAFILSSYHKSELPTILLAINFIILQIALLFLIAKEQILSIIPTRTYFGQWAHERVDHYYHLIMAFVIAIVVMINPYVGFGNLVRYLLFRFLVTIVLVLGLILLHRLLNRAMSHLFFHEDKAVIRDRFAYSKTWYGLYFIFILAAFIFLGCIMVAKVWGWPDTLVRINDWSGLLELLKTPIFFKEAKVPISVLSLLQIVFSIVGGFVVSFLINHFVLERIGDVMLVDEGVQNTVTSLMRYMIVMIAVTLGFQAAGLGYFVSYVIGALVLGIGWVIKEPMGDFIAYFIILVQRPIKIGDYISVDPDTEGVVRKITPRSVVLRRKNSTTIVLPNLSIINKPVVNWNYSRGFIAFNDIIITIQYREDPALVKKLLLQILDEHPLVLKTPKPIVRLDNFSELGFVFMVRGFLSSNYTLDQWDIASDVRLEMVRLLRTHNIRIAVPMRIVVDKSSLTQEISSPADEQDAGAR